MEALFQFGYTRSWRVCVSRRLWCSHRRSLISWVLLCLISGSLRFLIVLYEHTIILSSANHTGVTWFSRWTMAANVAPEPHNSEYPGHYPHFIPFPFPTITEIYDRQVKSYWNSKNIFSRPLPLSEQLWKMQALFKTREAGAELSFSWRSKRSLWVEVKEVLRAPRSAFQTLELCTPLKGTRGWGRRPCSDPTSFLAPCLQAKAPPGRLPKAKRPNL